MGRGGDAGEALRKTSDLTLKDTSSFILFEFSVRNFSWMIGVRNEWYSDDVVGGASSYHVEFRHGKHGCKLL